MTVTAPQFTLTQSKTGTSAGGPVGAAYREPQAVSSPASGASALGASALGASALGASPLGAVTQIADHRRPALSQREVEVLLAWLASESKEEAATRLFISASTVSTHISRIRAKYAGVGRPAPTKAHLLARALQDGYTSLADW